MIHNHNKIKTQHNDRNSLVKRNMTSGATVTSVIKHAKAPRGILIVIAEKDKLKSIFLKKILEKSISSKKLAKTAPVILCYLFVNQFYCFQ